MRLPSFPEGLDSRTSVEVFEFKVDPKVEFMYSVLNIRDSRAAYSLRKRFKIQIRKN